MTTHHSRRWRQLSLKSLFLLVLLAATFFAGYSLATKQAEAEKRRAAEEAQQAIEESQLRADDLVKQAQEAEAVARAILARQRAAAASLPEAPVADE
jgi:predicted negative regulator of RcsB-dependent stress response